jgi:hypothetical protein
MASLLEAASLGRDQQEMLRAHRYALLGLEDAADRYLRRGRIDEAIATAGTAAWLATLIHPGVLASPRLESIIASISGGLPKSRAPQARSRSGRERVLAVVTETYGVGGHSRLLWRWIARDPDREYSVVATSQAGAMSDGLVQAVRASGGKVSAMSPSRPALERAVALRALATEADMIVLLDHPYDTVPMLAFAALDERPAITMMNHGDHLFWLGRAVADGLMCTRRAGSSLAHRRGIPTGRVLRTPFPVWGPDGHGGNQGPVGDEQRARARVSLLGQLGWPEETVLMLTVGAAYKYRSVPGLDLLDLVEPVLAAVPRARLLAAGPFADGRWAGLKQRTGGRVAALGPVPEGLGKLYEAADIYVESRPLGGPGASAEAATHGLPVLGGAANDLERELFVTDEVYGTLSVAGVDAYRDTLARLVTDGDLRREFGAAAWSAIAAADRGWERAVEQTYDQARRLGPVAQEELSEVPGPAAVDLLIEFADRLAREIPHDPLDRLSALLSMASCNQVARTLLGPVERQLFGQLGRRGLALASRRRVRAVGGMTPPGAGLSRRSRRSRA